MIIIKKYLSGGLNSDLSPKLLEAGQYLNSENFRNGISEDGRAGRLENVKSTLLISQSVLPSGTHQTLGSAVWYERNMIIYFNWNSTGEHGIYAYAKDSGTTYKVLLNSQVTGGLNFSKSNRINRNAYVVDGLLYFTDGTENGQRRVNIEAGIKLNHGTYTTDVSAYVAPLDFSDITLIVPPPAYAPTIYKAEDGTFNNNFIANDSFSFAYQFVYRDNETSVVSAYSRASRLNKNNDTYNRIVVRMSNQQTIPDVVKIVKLIVRVGNTAYVVKTWDKAITAEATLIANHNIFVTPLTYSFYNNVAGEFLSKVDVLKPFDNVPRGTSTMEFAKDRNFLGNNLEGYDTPTKTSLGYVLNATNISASHLNKNLIEVSVGYALWSNDIFYRSGYSAYYVYLSSTEAQPEGYYAITSSEQFGSAAPPTLPTAPTSLAFSGGNYTFRGATQQEVVDYIKTIIFVPPPTLGFEKKRDFIFTANTLQVTGVTVSTFDVFKSKAQYQLGVVFYDFAMRKCGVVKAADLMSIPARDFTYTSGVQSAVVGVVNTDAVNEIPSWAYYYAFVRTMNLRTRFFAQSTDVAAKYVTKNADGEFVFDKTTFVTGCVAIGLDTTALVQSGLGYTFNDTDVCYLIESDGTSHELPVIGQSGKYILVKPKNIGTLVSNNLSYEIFTPYVSSEQEPFYEVGIIHKVDNPTTADRKYSVLQDIMLPDAYVMTRNYLSTTYFAEAMCPNDAYWKRWDNDGGKVNFVTKLGEQRKVDSISWSNTYIHGTAINGLSSFEALNQKRLPIEMGAIKKLQLSGKFSADGEGAVMVAICANDAASLYLGEVQVQAAAKNLAIVSGDNIIGTINPLRGGYGCVDPETVIEYNGVIFWIDRNNGRVAQYSANGLDTVSKYNMVRFFQKYCKRFAATSSSAIDTLNGFHHIPTAIDPSYRKQFLVITPALVAESAMTDFPSYGGAVPDYLLSIKNRFDCVDYQGKAVALSVEENIWSDTYSFVAEHYEYLNSSMYGFKNGLLYVHDEGVGYGTFYGVAKPSRMWFVVNEGMSMMKDIANISVEGNQAPDAVILYGDNPEIQVSDLTDADFTEIEGVYHAKVLRDRISPNASGTAEDKLFTGDVMKAQPLYVMVEYAAGSSMISIDAINVAINASKGTKQLIQK